LSVEMTVPDEAWFKAAPDAATPTNGAISATTAIPVAATMPRGTRRPFIDLGLCFI
jgi:hypothetical protein